MKTTTKLLAAAFLAGSSFSAMAGAPDTRLQLLEDQVKALSQQIEDIKAESRKQQDTLVQQQAEAKELQAEHKKQMASAAKPGISNGRLSISSADGDFSATVRAQLQIDAAYYMQESAAKSLPSAYGPDLSSGTNFRRIYLGLQGKVFGDFTYYFLYDFGGAYTATPGNVLYAYLQYDGFGPWAIRAGAYAPPTGVEDWTASGDLMFFERNAPANLQRSIAGAEGRVSITAMYAGDRLFGALSLTGDKVADGKKVLAAAGTTAVPNYDEQTAVVGRLAYLPVSTADAHWLVNANIIHVFQLPDLTANGAATLSTTPGATAAHSFSLADGPELTVDSNGTALVSTGSMSAKHVTSWGFETAANFKNFYGQAGYFSYAVSRAAVAYNVYSAASTYTAETVHPSNNTFSGWYLQGSWVITGETRPYNKATASFGSPKPSQNFSFKNGGWGALELVGRYSDLDLNSNVNDTGNVVTGWSGTSKTYTYYNTVRGGEQKIVTVGLNWYLNPAVKMELQYQYIDVVRLQTPATVTTTGTPSLPALNGGQTLNTMGLRFQIAI